MTRHRRLGLLAFCVLPLGIAGCEQLLTRPILYSTVRVEARSRAGVPLPGIRVELYTGPRPMGYAVTNDSGRVVFSRVPPSQYGLFLTMPAEYALLSEILPVPDGNIVSGINLDAGVDTTFRFTFARRGPGTIEAEVVDQSNIPLEGLTVAAYNPTAIVTTARTNASGIARMEVPFGQYGVLIVPPDSLGIPGAGAVFRDGLGVDADTPVRSRLVVPRCLGTIRPRVVDQSNLPTSTVPVTLYTGAGVRSTQSTDAEGRTTFAQVPCGNWGVFATSISGFTVRFERGLGFQDGLILTNGALLEPTLRGSRP